MSCELMPKYLSGKMGSDETVGFLDHVNECDRCYNARVRAHHKPRFPLGDFTGKSLARVLRKVFKKKRFSLCDAVSVLRQAGVFFPRERWANALLYWRIREHLNQEDRGVYGF